ncbi:MAG: transposase [Planctomycetes bacterium]|nr:transposase [Planctomycetota bacterium]
MPRTARASKGGVVYHVLNRGNAGAKLFYKDADYAAFVKLMIETKEVVDMRTLGYCLMPTHWHMTLWPFEDGDLSRYVGRLCNAHVRRHHEHYQTYGRGHVYQGRFKAFPVQDDRHLITVLRYVEANPVRAKLVESAEHWKWSSLGARVTRVGAELLSEWPVERPENWIEIVNEVIADTELVALRTCVTRGRPFGALAWVEQIARRLDLGFSLRPRGRPQKQTNDKNMDVPF